MPGCLFCSVVAGTLSVQIVLETPEVVAFLDHRPVFKGHTLVISREHVPTLADLPQEALPAYFSSVRSVAVGVETGLDVDGSFVAINNRISQSVPHLHAHVVPRVKGDGLRGFFWPRTRYADDDEAADFASRIAAAISASRMDKKA